MLDLKYVVENIDEVIERLQTRNADFSHLKQLVSKYEERKALIVEVEALKYKRNEVSKQIGVLKRQKKDTKDVIVDVAHLGDDIKKLDQKLVEIEAAIFDTLSSTPNLPHPSAPVGKDETYNVEIKKVGTPRVFDFSVLDHVALGEKLGILDFERAAKITGTRFVVDKGLGARLERSLIQFMMDTHALHNDYVECILPYIVNEQSMFAAGQFPKFKEDAFKVLPAESWYLNPTAEVPAINLHRDEILDADVLPLKYCAFTTAFRAEAGSAGRDTRGILRQHQFNKVELIKITKPEDSYEALEKMLKDAERILKLLKIPYRVVVLSTGDMGFGMAKTYDIEVWLPGQNMYREIASISNAEDFQARRANIRFKRTKDAKTEWVHTLNGSGLAVGRTMIAVMENYQNADGTITVPEVLRSYMQVDTIK